MGKPMSIPTSGSAIASMPAKIKKEKKEKIVDNKEKVELKKKDDLTTKLETLNTIKKENNAQEMENITKKPDTVKNSPKIPPSATFSFDQQKQAKSKSNSSDNNKSLLPKTKKVTSKTPEKSEKAKPGRKKSEKNNQN